MNIARERTITLFNWNILILPDEQEIFVGLRQRPEVVPPFLPPEDSDEILPFTLQNSSAIKDFDENRQVGFDANGTRYVMIGQPGDPTGMIQLSVQQMMKPEDIHWKYAFSE